MNGGDGVNRVHRSNGVTESERRAHAIARLYRFGGAAKRRHGWKRTRSKAGVCVCRFGFRSRPLSPALVGLLCRPTAEPRERASVRSLFLCSSVLIFFVCFVSVFVSCVSC